MKTFKHKTLGREARENIGNGTYYIFREGDIEPYLFIVKELIENSSDREEVIEKDWKIETARQIYGGRLIYGRDNEEIKEIISRNMPKVSEEEIGELYINKISEYKIIDLLRSKGLLLETKDK